LERAALKAAGKDIEHLTPDDLAPIDEFHNGQRNATIRLAQLAGVSRRGGARHSGGRAAENGRQFRPHLLESGAVPFDASAALDHYGSVSPN
jgi:hypothetical protein